MAADRYPILDEALRRVRLASIALDLAELEAVEPTECQAILTSLTRFLLEQGGLDHEGGEDGDPWFTLWIDCTNDAFRDRQRDEIATLLSKATRAVQNGEPTGHLLDTNGNTCGAWLVRAGSGLDRGGDTEG